MGTDLKCAYRNDSIYSSIHPPGAEKTRLITVMRTKPNSSYFSNLSVKLLVA